MNTWKLAFTNMKKSVSDYVVYFITLIFGVAIFYIFNAIGDQALINDLSESGYEIVQTMISLLTGASIGVALVLGFLIIYANNFLIRRRKKEFGIYLLLGMGKKQVSRILFCETLIAGLISLGVGLAVGILGSQFLSFLVGNFFDADLSQYQFRFSLMATIKTVISFVVMNLVVLLFHAATITKYQLVDLLSAGKKPETNIVSGSWVNLVLFVLSAAALGYAYYRVGFRGNEIYMKEMIRLILIGIVANMVLFRSLAGFLMEAVRRWKGFYHRKLNAFVLRQFCAGLRTSSITMGIICLMLFATILSFVIGFSMANQFQGSAREKTPVDFSIQRNDGVKVTDYFAQVGHSFDDWAKNGYVEVPIYAHQGLAFEQTVGGFIADLKEQFPRAIFWGYPAEVMALSDFNSLMRVYGQREITLLEDRYAVVCTFDIFRSSRDQALQSGLEISVGDAVLKPEYTSCWDEYLMMSGISLDTGTIIIPDDVAAKAVEEGILVAQNYIAAGDFKATSKSEKRVVDDLINQITVGGDKKAYAMNPGDQHMTAGTKISIRESNNGLAMMVTFLVTYVGVVFLLASAAILSLKALSESIDSQGRYDILKKLGCGGKMLRHALYAQIGVFFLLPMLIAGIHSVFGVSYAKYSLSSLLSIEAGYGILVTCIVMVVLYGGYMSATIRSSEKIVRI
ncbi:MAG: FtsX-like permease family protein [Lachnospiraceae bacterium]|nr:FtsX-like permease family protein [Lachnospiraceae bacterium]